MKTIVLLATGGTIASVRTPYGLAPLRMGETLGRFAPPGTRLIGRDLLCIDSADMGLDDQAAIARAILEQKDEAAGFVITHGTDTMAYTAAALFYLLWDIRKPVILTGSMRPLFEEGSDAEENLTLALRAAAEGAAGVFVAGGGRLYPGDRVTKINATDQEAFCLAGESYGVSQLRPGGFCQTAELLMVYPGMSPSLVNAVAADVLLLRGYGAGTLPNSLLPAIDRFVQSGGRAYLLTQCLFGSADASLYAAGQAALDAGVRPLPNLTPENALALARLGLLK